MNKHKSDTFLIDSAIARIKSETGLGELQYTTTSKAGTLVLNIILAGPSDRFYRIASEVQRELADSMGQRDFIIRLQKARPDEILKSAESKLFLQTIASNLNANQFSFTGEAGQYIRSVFGAEEQIMASGNHVVFGRRGAGKSSLLAYSFNGRVKERKQSVWLDMQTYSQRSDMAVVLDVMTDIFERTQSSVPNSSLASDLARLADKGIDGDGVALRKVLPRLRRHFADVSDKFGDFVIYLDDFHMVQRDMQATVLDFLYAFARGNRVFLKLSAIETLSVTYDRSSLKGMEIPQDLQVIRLDLNLTMPDKASEHIQSILEATSAFSGLPSVQSLLTGPDVLSRLVWTSAGVPRDALSVFSEAMGKSTLKGAKKVSVTAVNEAASKTVNGKLLDLERDAHSQSDELKSVLDQIKTFCVTKNKRNAFLIELGVNTRVLNAIHELVDLRLLHVINESLNTGKAGRRFQALILDYGFYTGTRAARSVDLFNPRIDENSYIEMRKLPVFRFEVAAANGKAAILA